MCVGVMYKKGLGVAVLLDFQAPKLLFIPGSGAYRDDKTYN